MSVRWNLWHGCHKLSPGCAHCYVYRMDARSGRDAALVAKTADYDLPIRRGRDGAYKIPSGERVYTCFTSDFFLEDADPWREEAWRMMRERRDLHFFFVTKRIDRFSVALPEDWGAGYENVTIACTVENQAMAERRLPLFLEAPIRHRELVCEPLLEPIDLERFLGAWIEGVTVGGESGPESRICDYDWVLGLREQCIRRGVRFTFKQTGASFRKDGRLYHIAHDRIGEQARRAGIDYTPERK
ncbi:MAG: DUF5131 family protein [Ruminococcaceae bacterium]|nr:DUF5131 family protein [Oscillospiraceae bacterium]